MTGEAESYSELEKQVAHFSRAIGHPARVAILMAIVKNGNLIEGEVVSVPQLSGTTVIQHLRELKRAGIIQGRIFGAKSKYSVDILEVRRLSEFMELFLVETLKPGKTLS